jgi:hypothetical protein
MSNHKKNNKSKLFLNLSLFNNLTLRKWIMKLKNKTRKNKNWMNKSKYKNNHQITFKNIFWINLKIYHKKNRNILTWIHLRQILKFLNKKAIWDL